MAMKYDKNASDLFGVNDPPKNTRDKIVQKALDLFYTNGFHAVGLDQILTEVGVTKTTFYNHFECKDDLAVAAVELRDKWEMEAFTRQVQEKAGYDPKAMLMAMFDVLDEWFCHPDYLGCLFIHASAEFPSPNDPVRKAAANHYRVAEAAIQQMAQAAGIEEVEAFAREWVLLMEGCIVYRQVNQYDQAATISKRIAKDRLQSYLEG